MESNVYETNGTLGAVHKLHRQERGRRGKVCQMPIVLHKFMRQSVVQRQAKRCRFACLFAKLNNTFDLWIGKIWKLQLMLIHHYVGVPTCIWNVVMGSIGNLRVQCYFSTLHSGGHFFQFCCQRFIIQSIDEIIILTWLLSFFPSFFSQTSKYQIGCTQSGARTIRDFKLNQVPIPLASYSDCSLGAFPR